MAVNDIIRSVYDGSNLVEQHVVTAETPTDRTIEVRDGNGTAQSTYTLQRDIQSENEDAIRNAVVTALQNNTNYLALSSPTAAQTTAQVQALTRQMNRLIRLITRRLDATS